MNGKDIKIDVPEEMPLLWILRDILKLKGTKFGCGKGLCGSCSVLLDEKLFRSCIVPASLVEGKKVTTIEGLANPDGSLHPVQQAWYDENVVQCGYCQPGFIMAAVDLIHRFPDPDEEDIKRQITNICRCGTYPRIINAIKQLSKAIPDES